MINRRLFLTATAATIALPMSGFAQAKAPEVMEMTMGNPDAKVTVTEYASFTCPHCARFHENTFPQLKENYIDTGRVKYILRPFPFDGDRRGEAAFMRDTDRCNNSILGKIAT